MLSLSVGGVTQTAASVSVSVANHNGFAVHLRHRVSPSGEWMTQSKVASSSMVEFSLADLTAGTAYDTQASFHSSFGLGAASASFTTQPASGEDGGRSKGSRPKVTAGPAITSIPTSGDTYGEGETIEVSVTFSEAVTVTGEPRVILTVGDRNRWARYAGGHGTTTLTFAYTVKKVDVDDNGVSIKHNRLELWAGSSIAGIDNTAAHRKHPAVPDQAGHKVDGSPTSPPTILAAPAITSIPTSGDTYGRGRDHRGVGDLQRGGDRHRRTPSDSHSR